MSYKELNKLIELFGNKKLSDLKPNEIKKAKELVKTGE